ncbi:MAG TPA: branched-chain amino acid ABC transporter permease [Burkholderiales bacterium]|jgi:branched-chain amino acid transport system permease protein
MKIAGAVVAAFLLIAPWLLPKFVPEFWVSILAEIMIWGLLASSANLLLGYTGLLSFGQSLYFGFGAYGVAFGITRFGLGVLPSFFLAVAIATLAAAIAGFFAVRLTWHYFAIITVVFSLIFYLVAVGWKSLTGGDDGLSFALPPIAKLGNLELTLLDPTFQYFFILAVVGACYLLQWLVLRSPLGVAFTAVRENATRAGLVGLNPYLIRLTSFVIAGFLAGVAGALFALFSRYASAQYMYWTVSGEAVIWTIVGGAGTLFGPAIGAALLILVREELSGYWEHYLILVGILVLLVVSFAPKGIVGSLQARRAARQ